MDLFDAFQSFQIGDPQFPATDDAAQAGYASTDARSASSDARYVRVDLQRLELIVQAMWELMKERGLTDDDLLAKIAQLDLADGQADGKAGTKGAVPCPSCARPNSRRRDFCMYCGELVRSKPFQ